MPFVVGSPPFPFIITLHLLPPATSCYEQYIAFAFPFAIHRQQWGRKAEMVTQVHTAVWRVLESLPPGFQGKTAARLCTDEQQHRYGECRAMKLLLLELSRNTICRIGKFREMGGSGGKWGKTGKNGRKWGQMLVDGSQACSL